MTMHRSKGREGGECGCGGVRGRRTLVEVGRFEDDLWGLAAQFEANLYREQGKERSSARTAQLAWKGQSEQVFASGAYHCTQ